MAATASATKGPRVASLSPEQFTLGIEEEYQLVDRETGELRSRARHLLNADWTGDIKPELQENTVEVGTPVCTGATDAAEELARLRFQTAISAEAEGLRIVAAGTHPFTHWGGQQFTDDPLYQQIREDYRRLAESQNIFGMHVHVGVPEGVDRVRVMNVARLYLPHLLAMTASSPFFLGEDTGFASYRTILWRRWPRSGPPPRLDGEAAFERLLHWLIATERIDAPGRLYWDMRVHHEYPTLVFRAADVTPRLEDAALAATLVRAVVAGVVEGVLREPDIPPEALDALLRENSWRAARDGLDASFADLAASEPRTVGARSSLRELFEQLDPIIRALGDEQTAAELPALLERGNAARRMQEQLAVANGDFGALTLWIAGETALGTGSDRRGEQRVES